MKVVSFVNMKGGVAKTTLAVNISDCLANRHQKKILLIDMDPQFNATQCSVAGDEYVEYIKAGGHTIIDIFDDSSRPLVNTVKGDSIREPLDLKNIKPWEISPLQHLLPGNLELYRLEMGAGQGRELRLKRYIDCLRVEEKYDFVLIDTPPTPSAWMTSALIASDYYLVPVKPEPLSATGIDLLRNIVGKVQENYGLTIKCLGVVLTIAEQNTIVYKNAINFIDGNNFWKGKKFQYALPKRTAVARSQDQQGKILESDDGALLLALTSITREFLMKIEADNG
jgi:chromosome partitioning protein